MKDKEISHIGSHVKDTKRGEKEMPTPNQSGVREPITLAKVMGVVGRAREMQEWNCAHPKNHSKADETIRKVRAAKEAAFDLLASPEFAERERRVAELVATTKRIATELDVQQASDGGQVLMDADWLRARASQLRLRLAAFNEPASGEEGEGNE